jgi:outer membrane receptor protein involved in Fe transport
MHLRPLLAVVAALLPLVLVQPAAAQPTPAPSSATPARPADDPVQLSPFIVETERETGWSANDTLSASRTRQALKDVPVNIDAITTDFMEDLGLFTADDVTRFVANVYAAPHMENDNNTDNFSFRGLSQRFNISRNYFRWYIPTDTYNVERIDFGKGSNSLIFGDVEPGGQGSAFTKRALFRNFGTLHAQVGRERAYRVQLDLNRQLHRTLALRFNAVRRADKTFQDFSEYGFKGQHLALTWRPFRHTEVRVEFERGDIRNQRGYAGVQVREQSARSLAFSGTGWYVTSDDANNFFPQAGLPAADRSTANNPAGGSPSLIEGGYFDVTLRNAAGATVGTRRVPAYPKRYNIRGSWDGYGRPFDTYSVIIEQRLGDLGLEFAYNRQNQEGLRNDNYFSNTISLDVNGRPYTDSVGIDLKRFGNDVDAFRFTAAYNWQVTKWMRQLVVLSGDYREDFTNNFRRFLYNLATVNAGGRVNTTTDRIRFRAYLDNADFYSRAFFTQFLLENLPRSAAFQPGMFAIQGGASAADATEFRQQSAVGVSASGNYFQGRLQSLFGVRWDWNKTLDFVGTARDARGEDLPPASPQDAPGDYLRNPNLDQSNKSYSAGLTLRLIPDLNAYAVYSNSFRFQDARTFDRTPFGPITGTTKEVGLKGDLFQRKVTFTLGAFHIDRANVEFRWNPSTFTAGDVESLFNPNNLTPGSPGYFRPWDDVNQYRSILSTETSKGFDLTLLFRPTKGLQTRFTLARSAVITRPDFSLFRTLLDAAIRRGDESPALIAEAQDVLNSSDFDTKPTGARASPWSASWVFDYAFPREAWAPLRGVRAGVNGSWRDNYLLAIVSGAEFYGGTSHLVNAYLLRDQKIWNQQVRFRFGVRNLVDLENSQTRRTGTTTLANGTTLYRLVYVMPPQWDFAATVRF